MKKCWIWLIALVLLAGCGQRADTETVNDVYAPQPLAKAQQILVQLPPEVYTPVLQTQEENLYLCDRYSLSTGTYEAGDLQRTVQTAAGFLPENLQMMETVRSGVRRYSFVWTSASDEGIQVGRGCILDDGNYHYVLTAMAPETEAGKLQETWHEIFASFRLTTESESDINTGS